MVVGGVVVVNPVDEIVVVGGVVIHFSLVTCGSCYTSSRRDSGCRGCCCYTFF